MACLYYILYDAIRVWICFFVMPFDLWKHEEYACILDVRLFVYIPDPLPREPSIRLLTDNWCQMGVGEAALSVEFKGGDSQWTWLVVFAHSHFNTTNRTLGYTLRKDNNSSTDQHL
jgi:hypothetical protein